MSVKTKDPTEVKSIPFDSLSQCRFVSPFKCLNIYCNNSHAVDSWYLIVAVLVDIFYCCTVLFLYLFQSTAQPASNYPVYLCMNVDNSFLSRTINQEIVFPRNKYGNVPCKSNQNCLLTQQFIFTFCIRIRPIKS